MKTAILLCSASLLALILAGCATPGEKGQVKSEKERVFFPSPPAPARIQFLCHLNGSTDFAEKSHFMEFVVGKSRGGGNAIVKPFGVTVYDHKIYVADTATERVHMLDMVRRTVGELGLGGRGALRKPINVRIGPDKLLYVTDSVRRQIVVFRPDGTFVRAYGDGKEYRPTDAFPTADELYVVDREQHRILVYDLATGALKRTLGKRGLEPGEFNYPTNIFVDGEGNVYVVDALHFRIQKLDRDGKSLLVFGGAGDTVGKFSRPKGMAVDRNGIIYVVDAMSNVVQLFDQRGKTLTYFGGGGVADGRLILPAQIHLDYDNIEDFRKFMDPAFEPEYLIFVTNQIDRNKVSVFAFGKLRDQPPSEQVPAPKSVAAPAG